MGFTTYCTGIVSFCLFQSGGGGSLINLRAAGFLLRALCLYVD